MNINYLAGLIDGEGTVTIARKKNRSGNYHCHASIQIASTTVEIIDALKEAHKGCACKQKKQKSHYKQAYMWRLNGRAAVALLRKLAPLLLEPSKRRRAQLISHELPLVTISNGKYTPQQWKRREDLIKRILNR